MEDKRLIEVPEGQVPKYRLLQAAFFAPKLLQPGTIIATHAVPGNHMEPLNEAAEQALENWYHQEYDEIDEKGKKTGEKVKPHLKFRIQRYEPGIVHSVEVLAEPKADDMTDSLSLAAVTTSTREDTDQRPGPAKIPEAVVERPTEAEALAEQSGVVLEKEAPLTGTAASVKVK